MCDVADSIGASLEEVGEWDLEELCVRSVHLAKKRDDENLRQDFRFGKVCQTLAFLKLGKDEFPPEFFFPSLKSLIDEKAASEDIKKRLFTAFAAAAVAQRTKKEIANG
jgi:hypothetical protein